MSENPGEYPGLRAETRYDDPTARSVAMTNNPLAFVRMDALAGLVATLAFGTPWPEDASRTRPEIVVLWSGPAPSGPRPSASRPLAPAPAAAPSSPHPGASGTTSQAVSSRDSTHRGERRGSGTPPDSR
jgi:hypothetical protein